MTKTTTPKAPRMTKAEKLAKIELETLAIEAQIAAEKATNLPALTAETILERAEIVQQAADAETTLEQAMKAVVTTKTMKVVKTVKTVKTGVGAQILFLIAQGELSNKEIVAKVLEDNPLRKTTYACVAWYKSQVAAGKIDLPQVTEEAEETTEE